MVVIDLMVVNMYQPVKKTYPFQDALTLGKKNSQGWHHSHISHSSPRMGQTFRLNKSSSPKWIPKWRSLDADSLNRSVAPGPEVGRTARNGQNALGQGCSWRGAETKFFRGGVGWEISCRPVSFWENFRRGILYIYVCIYVYIYIYGHVYMII